MVFFRQTPRQRFLFWVFCNLVLLLVLVDGNEIRSLNFQKKTNEKLHHTNQVRNRQLAPKLNFVALILRRGSFFLLSLETSSPLSGERDLNLSVSYQSPNGDSAEVLPTPYTWKFSLKQGNKGKSVMNISIPGNAPIGYYDISLQLANDKQQHQPHTFSLAVLLNPWSPSDSVFYPKQEELNEYLLNEAGIIWEGLADDYIGEWWAYEQFEALNLEVSLSLLYYPNALPDANSAADPIRLARHLSRVTAQSVCWGKWGGDDYTSGCDLYCCSSDESFPGTEVPRMCYQPWAIHNASVVLQQFYSSQTAVQFCQCFVYAAVLNTIARGLGFASRVITNFNSAADHTGNGVIDEYFEEDSKGYLRMVDSDDSIWNFHCWNELYIQRPKKGKLTLTGWQVVDGTPQVESDGQYQLGPAPVAVVKKGLTSSSRKVDYDITFVVAEVNGKVNVWVKANSSDTFVLRGTKPLDEENEIGKLICTKSTAPSRCAEEADMRCESDKVDITQTYKPTTNSFSKRKTINNNFYTLPHSTNERKDVYEKRTSEPRLQAELKFPKHPIFNGDNVKYGYTISNDEAHDVHALCLFVVWETDYNRKKLSKDPTKELQKNVLVKARSVVDVFEMLKPKEYKALFEGRRKNEDQGYLEFRLSVRIEEKRSFWFHVKHLLIHAK